MRFLVKATSSHEQFNSQVKNGTIDKTMQSIMADIKPEAAYFTELNGKRTALLIVNIDSPTQIPAIGEPWFLHFNADVEFHPVMSAEDLGKANLAELGKKWK